MAFGLNVTVTGAAWTTGPAVVTNIQTTTRTPTGAVNTFHTATLTGSDNRTVGGAGTLVLVTPIRIVNGALGFLPAFGTQTFTFVPEFGTMLLLGCGVASAVVAGRRRLRK